QPEKAAAAQEALLGAPGSDFRTRMLLADEFNSDGAYGRAAELAQGALNVDPQHLPALLRLGEAQLGMARQTAIIAQPVQTYEQVLALSPTNVRGLFGLAHALTTGQNFKGAAEVFQRLLAIEGDFPAAQRELARVLFADHQYGAADAVYQSIQSP